MKNLVVKILFAALLISGCLVVSQEHPERNVGAHRHPNLAAAQQLVSQAYQRVSQAQRSNEFDLGGHAQKAKELLDEVNRELKLAAEASNHDHRR